MPKVSGSFELTSWDEQTYTERDGGGKLTKASVTQAFRGDIEGDGAVEWLMAYRADGTAHFVGLQTVTGTVGGSKGSFVLETSGDFDGRTATWAAHVVPGTGSGELEGMTGGGTFGAPHGSHAEYVLEYALR